MSSAMPLSFGISLVKLAEVKTPLQPHQQRVVNRIQQPDQPGLVVAHGLGSGKTLTSIAAEEALGMPADVVVPASLMANYAKEMKKHIKGKAPKVNIQSMQNVANKGTIQKSPLLVVDEAHRLRETDTKAYQTLKKNEAKKRLLLTGSPFYNRPSDIAPLVNIASGKHTLPIDKKEFENRFVRREKVRPGIIQRLRGVKPGERTRLNPERKKELKKTLNKWVDYYEGSKEGYPEVTHEDVKIPMDRQQMEMYDYAMGKAPYWVRAKVRHGLPPTKAESKQLNAFLGAARQISNTTAAYKEKGEPVDPKIERAFQELKKELDKNPRAKGVVYSNFLQSGIDPYKKRLQEANIPYGEFTGEMPKAKRDELVKSYNENKIRALMLSSAGGEGLDLKGTRLMQVLEPHWNQEKLRQVEGRGIRYQSHSDLPKAEQSIKVQRFFSTRIPRGFLERLKLRKPGLGVDEYLTELSQNKERLNSEFRELLRSQQAEV